MASKKGASEPVFSSPEPVPESTAKGTGLPLFYQKPAALEKDRHAESGVVTMPELHFAKGTNSVALNALEFLEAAKSYPIVFSAAESPMPLAVVGLEVDNYFVDSDGKWEEGAYIPAYVRQYPFIFFENTEDDKFFLCIDEKAPHFRSEGGEGTLPLFNADGTPSPLSNQALEFCTAYYRHHAVTRNFTADLVKHKLLGPYHSQVTLQSGKQISLSGFQMIDEAAVNALSDEVFLEFRRKGWLPFITLAMSSASNWNRLVALANR